MIDNVEIVNLCADDENSGEQTAALLVKCFEKIPGAWDDMNSALQAVKTSLNPQCVSRTAVDKGAKVLGWISGFPNRSFTHWNSIWHLFA